ncbi:/ / hypothetical protein / 527704:528354 Reverse [Candidatus Hepatoplasma crinochetorum]|uniref:Uncharacterized protein n=1 Tax=Candidatus Hepatoplasma crinochetorum TaxID=295596 RepID=A0A0G7ZL93_9MOLU|nr:/ / hypothetical protein / 527704:528354 Reverse [Candidatus Hepatoplasma crinochetorum]
MYLFFYLRKLFTWKILLSYLLIFFVWYLFFLELNSILDIASANADSWDLDTLKITIYFSIIILNLISFEIITIENWKKIKIVNVNNKRLNYSYYFSIYIVCFFFAFVAIFLFYLVSWTTLYNVSTPYIFTWFNYYMGNCILLYFIVFVLSLRFKIIISVFFFPIFFFLSFLFFHHNIGEHFPFFYDYRNFIIGIEAGILLILIALFSVEKYLRYKSSD